MKTLLLVGLLAASAFAQNAPIPFGSTLKRGTTTLIASKIEPAIFGVVFQVGKPGILILLQTTNELTSEFAVTITTQDAFGKTHVYSDSTKAIDRRGLSGRSSILIFPTEDTTLIMVDVQEKAILSQVLFDGADQ